MVDAEGNNETRLTFTGDNSQPVWSPDGQHIAFTSTRNGNAELYVMAADGGRPIRLTDDRTGESAPAWSPDGRFLAFAAGCDSSFLDHGIDLYLLDLQSAQVTQITPGDAKYEDPAWSPDGRQLAYTVRTRAQGPYIFVMNRDGSERRKLAYGSHPTWSPDGRMLAFAAAFEPGFEPRQDLSLLQLDSLQVTDLGVYTEDGRAPSWSFTGQIAFARPLSATPTSGISPRWGVYVVNADGTGARLLAVSAVYNPFPAWSP